jgi:hypothetical protein
MDITVLNISTAAYPKQKIVMAEFVNIKQKLLPWPIHLQMALI